MDINIKHKALRRFAETGSARGLPQGMVRRLRLALDALETAKSIDEIPAIAWRLHQLKGGFSGHWSMRITGNWRLVFRVEDSEVTDVDLIDYH